jgi:hypothetical protein
MSDWAIGLSPVGGGGSLSGVLRRHGTPVSAGAVFRLWQEDAEFRGVFAAALAQTPFAAFRWETPAVTRGALDQAFEYVVHDAPEQDMPEDPAPFASMFAQANAADQVVAFRALRGDAVLIAPLPRGASGAYARIGAFLRRASAAQVDALWKAVGMAMAEHLNDRPLWLSTAGDGVDWLHVRLDRTPKYYWHTPYRRGRPA